MKIGIFGSGSVATTLGTKLVSLGHQVKLGARSATNDKAHAWAQALPAGGGGGSHGTFADAATFGELLFNCTAGTGSLDAVRAGAAGLDGKILVDVSNPLDFSKGMPPTLTVCNNDSLGEQIQRAFPSLKVVKALNTCAADIMVNPAKLKGTHDLLMCGNDAGAKATVTSLVKEGFGWQSVVDLGDITNARGTEAWLLLWIRLYGALQTPMFNLHLVRS